MNLSLVIPLYNEAKNLDGLLQMFHESTLLNNGLKEVILINNGSTDDSRAILDNLTAKYTWAKPIHLSNNLNYGGGVYEGLKHTTGVYVGYLPGDLQVSADDVSKTWGAIQQEVEKQKTQKILAKGYRTIRMDGFQTRTASKVYTALSNLILNLKIRDVNGLPKIFHKSLVPLLPKIMMPTFVFDAQLLAIARLYDWNILEIPVTFHARRAGVSSWSRKRITTYKTTIRQIFQVQREIKQSHKNILC